MLVDQGTFSRAYCKPFRLNNIAVQQDVVLVELLDLPDNPLSAG
jgi:hypothetical protein